MHKVILNSFADFNSIELDGLEISKNRLKKLTC